MSETPSHNPSNLESRLGKLPENSGAVDHSEMTPAEVVEGAEFKRASLERSERFLNRNRVLVDAMLESEQHIGQLLGQAETIIYDYKYRGSAKEQVTTDLRNLMTSIDGLSQHQISAVDERLKTEIITFLNDATETKGDVVRAHGETDVDERVLFVARQTEAAAEEMRGALKLIGIGGEERSQDMNKLTTLINQLDSETRGLDTIAVQIDHALSALRKTGGYYMRGLSSIQAECDTLVRLKNAES